VTTGIKGLDICQRLQTTANASSCFVRDFPTHTDI